ncbi:MAG TPA: TonB-dependent receptor [Lacunisphaera sp.]|nr:TonB-dependent receptor [Lacunisphaera sp.]
MPSTPQRSRFWLAVLAGACPLAAQTAPAPGGATEDTPVKLSPFLVSGSSADYGRYASSEATSAGRTRADLMDSSQSVSVLTSELLQDVAPGRVLDAARYVAGVADSTLPIGWDRTNVRGFLGDGRTVDGFTFTTAPYAGVVNMDPAIVDRIEVVKGPSSILAPQPTSPGGTINQATKKPQFRDFGLVSFQLGRFEANSAILDVNRVVNGRLAVRLVASGRNWNQWWQGAYLRSTTLMPGLTYRLSDSAQVTLQYLYFNGKTANYFGLPLDPTSGTTTPARLIDGVARDLDVYAADVYRADRQDDFKVLLTAELWHGIQMRLAAIHHRVSADAPQINTGPSTTGPGGSRDPLTGQWNYGLGYGQVPPFASFPLPAPPTRTYTRSGFQPFGEPRQWQVQNDYVYVLENSSLKSTTLVGFAYTAGHDHRALVYNLALPPLDLDHYVDTPWTRGTINYYNHTSTRFLQGYLSENLALWRNRVILNAAGSWQGYREKVESQLRPAVAAISPHTALPAWGIVLKPHAEAVSLYYSYTGQSSAIVPSLTESLPELSNSRQHEFGARVRLLDGRFYFTVSHYDIFQDNFASINPGNLVTPPPNPLLPSLISDRRARGWEYELRAQPARNLSLLGSFTQFKNRDPNNVEFRGTAERAGSLLASYEFERESSPRLAGVRLAFGVDYLGRRPGDAIAGVTKASTPDHVIPSQPSFYLAAHTLVNLTLAYDSPHRWGIQVNVDNLLDREYLMAANTRFAVLPGAPRNFRVTLRHGF